MSTRPETSEDVKRLFPGLSDKALVDILALGPDAEALEEAAAWLAQESDVMGDERKALSGVAAAVYEIVVQDEVAPDEGERR